MNSGGGLKKDLNSQKHRDLQEGFCCSIVFHLCIIFPHAPQFKVCVLTFAQHQCFPCGIARCVHVSSGLHASLGEVCCYNTRMIARRVLRVLLQQAGTASTGLVCM